ncbi:unnamed protein product, partial [marine sediment metagenome]
MLVSRLRKLLRDVFGGGSDISASNPLQVIDPKVGSLISYEGTTTTNGAGDGSTLIDSVLATKPDYNGNLVIITSGAYAGQARAINDTTLAGTVTPASAFGGQIVSGVTFVIVGIRTVPAEVAAIEAKLDHATYGLAALKALIDVLALEATLNTHDTDIKALLNAIVGYLDTEIAEILADVTGIDGAAMRGTDNALLAAGYTAPDNAGIATLLTRITAAVALASVCTEARLAELAAANIPADIDGLKTSRDRQLFSMDFWSLPQEEVALTVAAGDKALPSVTVADLPGTAT